MASAVGLRSEHTVHIDRSKETVRFYRLIYEQTQYNEAKRILCIFLYLDYEYVLSVYSIKLVTKKKKKKKKKNKLKIYRISGQLVYVITCIHSFRMALSYGR